MSECKNQAPESYIRPTPGQRMQAARRYDIFLADCMMVTARLTTEKLEVLLSGEPPMVDLCDVDGRCISVNPAQVTCIEPNRGVDAE